MEENSLDLEKLAKKLGDSTRVNGFNVGKVGRALAAAMRVRGLVPGQRVGRRF